MIDAETFSNPEMGLPAMKELIRTGFGSNYMIVHKNGDEHYVEYLDDVDVEIEGLTADSYWYPGEKRKYIGINFFAVVNGQIYKVQVQLRGTTSRDEFPYYIRILLTVQ